MSDDIIGEMPPRFRTTVSTEPPYIVIWQENPYGDDDCISIHADAADEFLDLVLRARDRIKEPKPPAKLPPKSKR